MKNGFYLFDFRQALIERKSQLFQRNPIGAELELQRLKSYFKVIKIKEVPR